MMADKNIIEEVLTYLKEEGPINTFRLASKTGMKRQKLLNLLNKLAEKQAIRLERGNAIFNKFISEEKPKSVKIRISSPRPEQKIKKKIARLNALQLLQIENKQLRWELSQLKETVKELEKKANAPSKIITKTIIKRVPIIRTIIKKIAIYPHKSNIWEKLKARYKQFKFPKLNFKRYSVKLKKPEFMKLNIWEKLKAKYKQFKFPKLNFKRYSIKLKKPEFMKLNIWEKLKAKYKQFKFPMFNFMKHLKKLKK